jgi:hypothetical protein
MAITDIQISEELETNAPSIKYSGNEGPKSPQEVEMVADAMLQEEYEKYVYDLLEIRPEATPMSFEEFRQMVIAEGQMSGGQPLPQDPTKPVNPFQPKPTGPTLPDRQMAADGGIMEIKQIGKPGGIVEPGITKYGILDFIVEAKDKIVDDLIPNEIKENPMLTAALIAGGVDLSRGENSILRKGAGNITDYLLGEKQYDDPEHSDSKSRSGGALKRITGIKTGDNRTLGGDILGGIAQNIVPIVGGIGAGLFTRNTESNTPGLPDDNTALNLAEYKKAANLLDQKQGLAAGMNFIPTVASRKYSPEEMAITYAQAVANGGRIGFNMGGGADMGAPQMNAAQATEEAIIKIMQKMQDPNLTDEDRAFLQEKLQAFAMPQQQMPMMAMGGRINRAEGGIMDLGGMEKDYRAEGGFVPIGKEEKADDVPARLSVNEFVFTADAVRNAGGGDIDEGARVMENMMKHLEAGGQVSEESQGMAGARDMFAVSERLSEVV